MPPIKLHVEIKGKGFPILCLHGHPGSIPCMSVFTQHLSKQFTTITPDLRGYGKTPALHSFQMTDHLLDLEALLDQLQVDQCFVLGWSLGGILALELALKFPEKITGLILIATAARPRSNHPPLTAQDYFYTALVSIINLLIPGWYWNIKTFGTRSLYRYLLSQHSAIVYQHLAKEGTSAYLQTSKVATEALNQALQKGYNRLTELEQITCPCLILAGEDDHHITASSSLETAQHLPQAESRCYPQTAHLFPWEISHQVLSDIDLWLNTHFPNITNTHIKIH
ncbi:MAG: hypothetical protein RLZZ338_3293 [Cyanobacteriota bacterium]